MLIYIGIARFFISRLQTWLKGHFAESSCDPMMDACWKWGQFYFNRDDPALVVPARTGIFYSLNYARCPIWTSWVVVMTGLMLHLGYTLHVNSTLP